MTTVTRHEWHYDETYLYSAKPWDFKIFKATIGYSILDDEAKKTVGHLLNKLNH